jgi:hypothetical protein
MRPSVIIATRDTIVKVVPFPAVDCMAMTETRHVTQ